MKSKILLITIFTFMLACKPKTNSKIVNISVEELKEKLNDNIQLLDVRTPEEWEKGVINNALKVNVTSDDFETKATEVLNIDKPVYVYCKSGGRSLIAGDILAEKGFKVYNIEGGYLDWVDKIKE